MTTSAKHSRLRALSGALDQVFSSISNGFIVFAVAVVVSAQEFGYVTILMTSLMAVVSCVRGGFGIPLLLRADQPIDSVRREGSHALSTVFILGPLVSAAMLIVAPEVNSTVIALAVSAPIVLGQDVLRYVAMAAGRPQVAAVWDGIWCAGTLLALVSSWIGFSFINAGTVLAAWGSLALVAFIAMSINLRILPVPRGYWRWIKPDWQHRVRYAADAGLEQVGLLIVFAVASTVVNPDAAGALRGAIALLAPLLIMASAVQIVMIPESVRASAAPQQVWRNLSRVGTVMALLAAVAGVIFAYLPAKVGFFLLGDSFASAQQVIPIMTAQFIAAAVTFVIQVYLRTFNRSADVLRLKIGYLVAISVAATISAHVIGSAVGIGVGLTVATSLVAGIAFITLSPRRSDRGREEGSPSTGTAIHLSNTPPVDSEKDRSIGRLAEQSAGSDSAVPTGQRPRIARFDKRNQTAVAVVLGATAAFGLIVGARWWANCRCARRRLSAAAANSSSRQVI